MKYNYVNEIQLCINNFPNDVFVGICLRNKIIFWHCNALFINTHMFSEL